MLNANLIHPKESRLQPLVFGVSGIAWLLVLLSMIGACYGAMLLPFILLGHALMLGAIRGSGLRVDAAQMPELHARVVAASEKLQLPSVPEVYVLQSGGVLNAFATKLLSRTYVVLYSELIDKCNDERELDFVIAHELAHHAAGHLKFQLFTAPVRLIPLLGPAYSRACEYTCDRAGSFAVESLAHSQRALAVLAAGSKMGATLNLTTFASQRAPGEFWPAVAELSSSHPFLSKRVAALANWHAQREGQAPPFPQDIARPAFSYVLACFVGRQAFTILMVTYFVFVIAAIASTNFARYRQRAHDAATQGATGSTDTEPSAGEYRGSTP